MIHEVIDEHASKTSASLPMLPLGLGYILGIILHNAYPFMQRQFGPTTIGNETLS